jgi:general stress protein YciG
MSTKDRGFASMLDRVRQRVIASTGGKAAQRKGTAHKWTTEEARAAGRKGGAMTQARKRAARKTIH